MSIAELIHIDKLNDHIERQCGGKEYFLGCWSVNPLEFDAANIPKNLQMEQGKNWVVIRNGADKNNGIIFPKTGAEDTDLVVFRGYLLEQSIHSYSPRAEVRKYWSGNLLKRHNGVFSAVTISDKGGTLNIITDLFGISPVYYRKVEDVVFFSSSPGLLSIESDDPDFSAWFMRIVNGNVPGRKTLSNSIEIAHHSSVTTFSDIGKTVKKWFDFKNFPPGDKPVSDQALDQSEQVFTRSMKRCQMINNGKTILPLTSGHDSRRIFAHLVNNKISFDACTVQIPASKGGDVDAPYSEKIAKHYNIKHTVLKYPAADEWHDNDIKRLFIQDGQSDAHTWSVPFFKEFGDEKLCFYDGLGGDLFGYDGWKFVKHIRQMKPENQLNFIKKGIFPNHENISNMLDRFVSEQPAGPNQSMLTFALWQSRKGTGVWAQQQLKPGQIFLYPYFDIDYIENMLEYSLDDNDSFKPQKIILEKYWPKLASFSGSRDIASSLDGLSKRHANNLDFSLQKLIKEALANKKCRQQLKSILTLPAWVVLHISQYFPALTHKAGWWLQQTVELVYWWQSRPFIITIKKRK